MAVTEAVRDDVAYVKNSYSLRIIGVYAMKGILKGGGTKTTCNLYLSDRRPVTIGRDDTREAVIEFNTSENCFEVQDIGTSSVFVNNFQVRCGSAVALNDGDVIRLGSCDEQSVEYLLQILPTVVQKHRVSCALPCRKHSSSTSEDGLRTGTSGSAAATGCSSFDWINVNDGYSPDYSIKNSSAAGYGVRRRSAAASGATCVQFDDQCRPKSSSRAEHRSTTKHDRVQSGGLVDRARCRFSSVQDAPCAQPTQCDSSHVEDPERTSVSNDADPIRLADRLSLVKNELVLKTAEIEMMQEQISQTKPMHQLQVEMNCLKKEAERLRMEKSVSSAAISQMQQEISERDLRIWYLMNSPNISDKSCEMKDCTSALSGSPASGTRTSDHPSSLSFCSPAMGSIFNSPVNSSASVIRSPSAGNLKQQQQQLRDAQETQRLIDEYKQRAESTELSLKLSQELVAKLQNDLRKAKSESNDLLSEIGSLKTEWEDQASQVQSFELTAKISGDSLQKVTSSLSKLRSKLSSVLGPCDACSGDASDEQLIEQTREIVEEHRTAAEELEEVRKQLAQLTAAEKSLADCCRKVREEYQRSNSGQRDMACVLKQQAELFRNSMHHRSLTDVRCILLAMIQTQLDRMREVEDAFELAGVDTQSSASRSPVQFVQQLVRMREEDDKQCKALKTQMDKMSNEHRRQLELTMEKCRREGAVEEKERDRFLRDEHIARLQAAVDQATKSERRKMEAALTSEQSKNAVLESTLAALEEEIQAKTDEIEFYKEQDVVHQNEVDAYRKVEMELREQIVLKETSNSDSLAVVEECLRKKYERDLEGYRQQSAYQEATIAAHQQRLNNALKAARKNQSSNDDCGKGSAKTSQLLDKVKLDLTKQQNETKKLTSELTRCRTALSEKDLKLANLNEELTSVRKQLELSTFKSQGFSELTELGGKCQGERHVDVIEKQREAIMELRENLSSVVKNIRSASAQSEVQKVSSSNVSRNALAGSIIAVGERSVPAVPSILSDSVGRKLDKGFSNAFGDSPTSVVDAVNSRHVDTVSNDRLGNTDNVELRDETVESTRPTSVIDVIKRQTVDKPDVLDKAREAFELLEHSEVAHAAPRWPLIMYNPTVFVRLVTESLKLLSKTSKEQTEKLSHLDKDFTHLRNVEAALEEKSRQVESLTSDLCDRIEETLCLREIMNRLREDLDNEKQLNAAFKARQTSPSREVGTARSGYPKHRCSTADSVSRCRPPVSAGKSPHDEKIKRKDCEIAALRRKLACYQRELDEVKVRLHRPMTVGSNQDCKSDMSGEMM